MTTIEWPNNIVVDYALLHLPDGKIIKYGVDTMSKLGMDCHGNIRMDETIFKSYEEVESKIRYLKVKEGDIFLDVGACLGSWSVYAAMYGATVHAFEVGQKQLTIMNTNIYLNSVGKKITAYKLALTKDDDTKYVYHDGFNIYEQTSPIQDTISSATLDTWVKLLRDELPHINYIKIDVEGMEYDVLLGAVKTIREYKPKLIVEIHNSEARTNVETLLHGMGYKQERVPGLNDYFYFD